MKTCNQCNLEKDDNCFTKRAASADGLDLACRDCMKIERSKNKEKQSEYNRKYREVNREKLIAYTREWRAAGNKPKRNPETIAKSRQNQKEKYRNDPEYRQKVKDQAAAHRKARKEKAIQNTAVLVTGDLHYDSSLTTQDFEASGIYQIRNTVNGKRYVGSAIVIGKRFEEHQDQLKRGVHHSRKLQHSWNKYGSNAFEFSVLEYVPEKENLISCEQHYIDLYDSAANGLNICHKAGSPLGREVSEETRAKLRQYGPTEKCRAAVAEANRKRVITDETRAKISKGGTGRVWTKESKAKRVATWKANQALKPTPTERKCPRCEIVFPVEIFFTSGGNPKPYCSECTRLYERQRAAAKAGKEWAPSEEDEARREAVRLRKERAPEGQRICARCDTAFPLEEFLTPKGRPRGYCGPCSKKVDRERYLAVHPDKADALPKRKRLMTDDSWMCPKCNQELPKEEFLTSSGKKKTYCSTCTKMDNKERYAKDSSKQIEAAKNYAKANAEKVRAYQTQYRDAHREHLNQQAREYRAAR